MMLTITKELRFKQSPERVWRALTDPAALADWMFPNDFEPRVGHSFTFRAPAAPGFDGVVRCEVTACEPPSALAFTWVVGGFLDTRVSYRLEADGAGTRVLFEHTGFPQKQAFGGAKYGWNLMHDKLEAMLERVPS